MKPLLAHIYEPHRVSYSEPVFVQPKLNGIRALYQAGRFQSRDEIPFPVGLLDHLAKPLGDFFDDRTILDGELYAHGLPLQRINAAVTPVRQEPNEDTKSIQFCIFDRVDYAKPFEERFREVCDKLKPHPSLLTVTTVRSHSSIWSDRFYANMVADGFEGIMYRLGDCPYTVPKQPVDQAYQGMSVTRPGFTGSWPKSGFLSDKDNRVWHMLKRKDWQDDEFECVGLIEGEGKYEGTLGAITCRVRPEQRWKVLPGHDKSIDFSVGSGFSDAERDAYWKDPSLVVGHLIKVKYLVLSSDGIPLNPTCLAVL